MYKFLTLLLLVVTSNYALLAEQHPILIHNSGTTNNHLEYYPVADMPDAVYYDSDEGEIIIVADGTSLYYNVEIVSDYLNQTVIMTQVDGYGDTIDVSSLPTGSYTIVITSEFLNEYEGQFTII